MTNRWQLTEGVKEKFLPIVQGFINKLEASNPDEEENLLEVDLSGTELNPFTLQELLESLGYKKGDADTNGWEMDFWIPMNKEGFKTLSVDGTGMIFALYLREKE
ncbi:hypothetical protein [Paenibacillus agilis]|uniref:Uncharacterized protein n=1 Tax=Paenibacillus agilis TaxID=3020863 RepID=A0A559IEA3_9BACL|nr:hypothetical protein [Paenibacillus agilis]TVX85976.1 hypothetical protein FPZ44_23790 [Paenibacillus agilis]